jgi:hypothetical protein
MNKKGIAPLMIGFFVVIALLGVYLILLLPIPSFTKFRMLINYFFVIAIWILLQVGLIYGYYKIGEFATKGILAIKNKVFGMTDRIHRYLYMHS